MADNSEHMNKNVRRRAVRDIAADSKKADGELRTPDKAAKVKAQDKFEENILISDVINRKKSEVIPEAASNAVRKTETAAVYERDTAYSGKNAAAKEISDPELNKAEHKSDSENKSKSKNSPRRHISPENRSKSEKASVKKPGISALKASKTLKTAFAAAAAMLYVFWSFIKKQCAAGWRSIKKALLKFMSKNKKSPRGKAEAFEKRSRHPQENRSSAEKQTEKAHGTSGLNTGVAGADDLGKTRISTTVNTVSSFSERDSRTVIGTKAALVKKPDIEKPAVYDPSAAETKKKKFNETDENVEVRDKGGVIAVLIKAFVYLAVIIAISVGLAIVGIRTANDVFAFVKDDITSEVTIPELATVSEVGDILESDGLIKYADAFKLYIGYKYRNKNLTFVAGTYTLNAKMNYDELVYEIKLKKPKRTIKTIVFAEGMTVDEIIDMLVSNGIGTREKYIDAIQNYDYKYTFMDNIDFASLSSDRKYRLEGYLYPDTYQFYSDSGEVAVIDKFLSNFEGKFTQAKYDRIKELGMTLDQVITLASIIQKEAKFYSEFANVSSVFHNRLNSSAFPKLESDATIQYLLPEHKEVLTHDDTLINHPYNTYQINGLPPGAICNPGLEAINAALDPANTNYYYFLAATDGTTVFAKTLAEQNENIRKKKEGSL